MAKKNPRATNGKATTLSRNHRWKTVAESSFSGEQCPMIVVVMALGLAAALLQYGYVPNGDQAVSDSEC